MSRPSTNDVVRKTWDDAAYSMRAAARLASSSTAPSSPPRRRRRAPTVPSAERVDLVARAPGSLIDADSMANTSVVVADGASKADAGAFYCRACDVLSHDSSAYLNHMNSRAHQAVMGVAMRVKRSNVEDVRAAFHVALERRTSRCAALGRGVLTLDQLLAKRAEETKAMKDAKRAERLRKISEREASKEVAKSAAIVAKINETAVDNGGENAGEIDEEERRRAGEMEQAGLTGGQNKL